MKVRVKQGKKGFIYNSLRREGDEFELEDDQKFSKEWMEKVDKPKAKPGPKPKAEKVEEKPED
jgi:hypothetical protein